MDTAEIKVDLFRRIDSLKGKHLEEAYGILLNFINGSNDIDDWQNLSPTQQSAIKLGVEQLENGEGRNHQDVMSDIKTRYGKE